MSEASATSQQRRAAFTHALPLLLLGVAACSFDTQPIFAVSRDDAGTGQSQGANRADAQTDATVDAGSPPSQMPSQPDAAGTGSVDASHAVCKPGAANVCANGSAFKCNAAGEAIDVVSCGAPGCNAHGTQCRTCVAGQQTCRDATTIVTCSADGDAQSEQTCALGCSDDASTGAVCKVCSPDTSVCVSGQQTRCAADGRSMMQTACASGCDASNALCQGQHLKPANLPEATCLEAADSDLDVGERTTIDTDMGCTAVVQQPAGAPAICVMRYRDIRISPEGAIRARGARALALVATRSLRVEGSIGVGARGQLVGAGAMSTDRGRGGNAVSMIRDPNDPDSDLPANAAGGGGGYAVNGATGGDAPGTCGAELPCTEPGAGGAAYGNAQLVPLLGGASGGRNSASPLSSRQAPPGGGGGALELVACDQLSIGAHAYIEASGGGGGGGMPGTADSASDTPGAGAGGGSGGAILIQALRVSLEPGAVIAANGGGGGGGATRTGGAENDGEDSISGMAGQDGPIATTAATGGQPGGGDSRAGGIGGTSASPGAGESAPKRSSAAGGGGGSAGRIRIDTAAGTLDIQTLKASPAPSVGRVTTD